MKDLHLQPSRSERDASSIGLTRRYRCNWCIRQDSRLQTPRSKRSMIIIFTTDAKIGADGETRTLVGQCPAVYKTAAVAAEPHRQNGGLPRIRTEFSPVKSRDFTVKVCNPDAPRWTTSPLRAYYRHQYEHQHHAFSGKVSASRRFALRDRRTPRH